MSVLDHLSSVSAKRVVEPEELFDWSAIRTDGPPIAIEKVSAYGLGDWTDEQYADLATEEVCATLDAGARMETMLCRALSDKIVRAEDLTQPWIRYALHEVGEETRHTRAFLRFIEAYGPLTRSPFFHGPLERFLCRPLLRYGMRGKATWAMLTLIGEEVPDLLQAIAADAPDTDPVLAAVNRYHRSEEARHIAFAQHMLGARAPGVPWHERIYFRYVSGFHAWLAWAAFFPPSVYGVLGLTKTAQWRLWWRAQHTPARTWLRQASTRPVLKALRESGALKGKVPRMWRHLCGVDADAQPLT